MSTATLLVVQGVDQGSRFEIREETVGLGRGVHNPIRILDTEVSRQHAVFGCLNGKYYVQDRNSSNGTFVNGINVRSKKLKNGDQVQIGRTVLLFSQPNADDGSQFISDRVEIFGQGGQVVEDDIVEQLSHEVASHTLLGKTIPKSVTDQAQAVSTLQVLYSIAEEVSSPSNSPEELMKRILDLTIDVVGADRGCVLLEDPQSGKIQPHVFSGSKITDTGDSQRMPISRSIVDYVVANKQGVRTSDARRDQRFATGQSILQAGIREAMCVPIQSHSQLMGVMYVDTTSPADQAILSKNTSDQFTEDQLRLLVAIGRQAALALENSRYQQALVKAERLAAMGQTIAMLSHHIKNILQGVRGGSYLIDMGMKQENQEFIRKGWDIVERNQNKIYHLVLDMLSFSKERQPVLQMSDLNELVEEICESLEIRATEADSTLEFRPAENLDETLFDPEAMHRAVLNIVVNAIDAVEIEQGGTVLVQTGYNPNSDQFYVSVSDNGPGISSENMKKIFNVFESSKGAGGTGLGLAVSQKIMREHGGEITVDSEEGKGSRFLLSWPRIDEEGSHDFESPTGQ